ncbi:MAG: BatD family protein [Bdellovibrionota bacterium]
MTPLRIGKAALIVALFSSAPALAADAEPKISVSVTPNPVSERESVQLQVVVESPLSAVVLEPTFDAPEFVQTGNRDMKFQPLNSDFGPNTRKRLVFTYVLMPKKPGDFLIGNIRTKVSGQPLTAPNVRVQVTVDNSPRAAAPVQPGYQPPSAADDDEASNPASPNYRGGGNRGVIPSPPPGRSGNMSVPDRFNSDFTVWASVPKSRAYIGEPVVVEYYLYDFGGLRQTEVLQWPTFTGFWKEDLEIGTHVAFEEVYVKQQEVRRTFLARYALYGIKPGKFSIDKLGIRGKYAPNDILSPSLVFNMDLRTGQHFSQDASIEILPLPEAGRPPTFRGGVGKFALKLEADKTAVPQNTPINFTFTLTGEGNFQSIDAMKLTLPPDFELYESTTGNRQVAPVGVKQELESKKTFQVVAIPRKAGKFEIPAVQWSYFDPLRVAYETLSTTPIQIEVTPNESNTTAANTYLGPQKEPSTTAAPDDLRYLKPLDLSAKAPAVDPLTLAVWAALLANLALAARFLRRRSRSLVRLVKGIDRFSEARILLLQAKGIRDAEWQAGLEEVVLMTMQVMLETNPRGLPRNDLEEMWKTRGLPAQLFQRASALLDEIDRHRFSSQKLTGSGTKEVRSRLTKETESLLIEASKVKRK